MASNKPLIAKKTLQEAEQARNVAWETSHTVASLERYRMDLMRVCISLERHGMTVEETALATGLSISLAKEQASLIGEAGLADDQLANCHC